MGFTHPGQGRRPRGCVNHIETDITNLYRGHVLIKVLFIFQLKACSCISRIKKLVGMCISRCTPTSGCTSDWCT